MSEWVDVKKQLPKEQTFVLTYNPREIEDGSFPHISDHQHMVCFFEDDEFREVGEWQQVWPTHWQELPDNPNI